MRKRTSLPGESAAESVAVRHMWTWVVLVGVLALHVLDEALTDFLSFYNPLVLEIRSQISWFPMPTFGYEEWLVGLIALVVMLALLAPAVRQGAIGTNIASWVLSGIMFLNGLGHLAGSVYFRRWLPGATSAPLLLIASVLLVRVTWKRWRADRREAAT